MKQVAGFTAFIFVIACVGTVSANRGFCPNIFHKGVLELDVNPGFLNIDEYISEDGTLVDGLTISSFFNMNLYTGQPLAADQVGRIVNIDSIDPETFDFDTHFEKLTDRSFGQPKTTWPNDVHKVPDGVLPFEAVVLPQGFLTPFPGRLTIINLDDPNRQEYIVHQSTMDRNFPLGHPNNSPRFYHEALFYDMDGDGLEDIVTVRSGFKMLMTVQPPMIYPPFSELVYFRNPGELLDPNTPWQEIVLYGGPFAGFMGPDVALSMYDFEGDGVPEIVATHFFNGDDAANTSNPPRNPTKGKIAIYGAPSGPNKDWSDVNAYVPYAQPRVKVISEDQGFPFGIEIVDLNGDGNVEILATNHEFNCTPYPTTDGRVYALQQPASGDIFNDEWTARVLLDGIRPQPNPAGSRAMRMAPGHAITFFPKENQDKPGKRPWIVVSGDQAGKVWLMTPRGRDFDYRTAVIFDINDYYGPNTTQTPTDSGTFISTVGKPALRYDYKHGKNCKKKKIGVTEIYVPVFEGQDIHVFSFAKEKGDKKVKCPADITLPCSL